MHLLFVRRARPSLKRVLSLRLSINQVSRLMFIEIIIFEYGIIFF